MFSPREFGFFENLFRMNDGGVLNFSRASLTNFIRDSVNVDVSSKYYLKNVKNRFGSDSKANILRYFWENENFDMSLKLISDLIDYHLTEFGRFDNVLKEENNKAKFILNNYYDSILIENNFSSEKRIVDLINEINNNILEGKYIFALDKLHTLTHNILRQLCKSHSIAHNKKDRIDELFKKYVKFLEKNKFIESKMTKSILKQSSSLLSQFNDIRNNNTYVHDNPILNNFESKLIYNHVVNILLFIDNIDNEFKVNNCINFE